MAEKELETVEDPQEVEASQPEKEEKMVSVAEMQRRLKQMEEKHTLEIADTVSYTHLDVYKRQV